MPYRELTDAGRLQSLLGAVLLIESDLELEALLHRIVEVGVELADATYGALGVLDVRERRLAQFIQVGIADDVAASIGHLPEGRGVLGLLIDDPRPVVVADLTAHPSSVGFPEHHPKMTSFLGVPIHVRGEVYGNLYLADKSGGEPFSADDLAVVETLALAAGIAIANARLHARVSELSVAEDRDRIARDLHDTVIQRLYGIGLSLQGTLSLIDAASPKRRVQDALDEIDTTIRQIRTTIFELETPTTSGQGLRTQILALAAESSRGLGFEPEVRFGGPLDTAIDEELATNLLAVLREALSNVARHASARRVGIEVLIDQGELHAIVADDGVGLAPSGARPGNGLSNMAERASALGGSFTVESGTGGGCTVHWSAPV